MDSLTGLPFAALLLGLLVQAANAPAEAGETGASPGKERSPAMRVSTLEFGSLERNAYATPLRWPYMHGDQADALSLRFFEKDRLEFFCGREILFHGPEEDRPLRAASLDPVFGVRFRWPYEARRGERYTFTFTGAPPPQAPGGGMKVNDLELPDIILVNGRLLWRRSFGQALTARFDYVAPQDGPLDLTLVKDRAFCLPQFRKGWGFNLAVVHPICHGYVHLDLRLKVACEHGGPTDQPATPGEEYKLPQGLRTFYSPGPWKWVPDQTVLDPGFPPVEKPPYPTDGVLYNQFHDSYLDRPEFMAKRAEIINHPERVQELVKLSLANGINCFVACEEVLQALEALGLKDEPITLEYSGGYIKRGMGRTAAEQRERRKAEGERIAALLRRFPKALVVYRLNEFSGCQYCHVVDTPEDQARTLDLVGWYEFTRQADAINREATEELFAAARKVDPARFIVGANVQTGHLAAHPLHCGADFTIDKTIGRNQVNLVVASSRGVNTAFDRWIGLQHDAWGALHYNYDSAREIEAIHRSFFFNGARFHDAEFGSIAVTAEGRATFNLKGWAWARVTRLAAIHPRRGSQRVTLGFLRGSDHVWGWYYPLTHLQCRRGYDGYDPADPKEYVDFDLLNVAFPKFGNWMSFNPERFLTGTPYGPCDLVPWDAPAKSLARYKVLVMLGANRIEEENWRHYVEYVRGGGVLVLGLYQVLAPARDRTYFKEDLSELLGVRLGRDVPLSNHATLADRQTFISQHYNRVQLAGAEAVERLPNGDPLLTRFKLGDGWAYFFPTDRLTTAPGAAERLIRGLFEPHVPVTANPASDRMEIAVSAKGDVRIVTLMDHGRDALPTDAGEDTGPYAGTVTLNLDRLGLPEGEYEVFAAQTDEKITRLELRPLACARKGRALDVQVQGMGPYLELVIGPKGKAEHAFFRE